MTKGSGLILSYVIGIIFAVGGLLFLIFLDERRFLFGIPYLLIGVLLIGGVARSQRSRPKSDEGDEDDPPPSH